MTTTESNGAALKQGNTNSLLVTANLPELSLEYLRLCELLHLVSFLLTCMLLSTCLYPKTYDVIFIMLPVCSPQMFFLSPCCARPAVRVHSYAGVILSLLSLYIHHIAHLRSFYSEHVWGFVLSLVLRDI